MNRQCIQSTGFRCCLIALLALVVMVQSMMAVADPHRLYQPQNGHLEAGHAHAFELLGDGDMPLPLDEHERHGGHDTHDHDHCCHCHGSLSLFVLPELSLPTLAVQTGHSIYGFQAMTHTPARLSRPPIS